MTPESRATWSKDPPAGADTTLAGANSPALSRGIRLLKFGRNHPRLVLSLFALCCLIASWIMLQGTPHPAFGPQGPNLPLLLILASANVLGGFYPVGALIQGLRKGEFDIDFLMLLAAVGAILLGDYWESGLLLFLFALSGALHDLAGKHMRRAVSQLKEYEPQEAALLRNGQEILTPVEEIRPGDTIVLWPGQRLALDGEVLQGTSYMDESMITGEGLPVKRGPGAKVFAGSLNGLEALQIRVTLEANASQLQKIIQLIERAQESSVPLQRRIDHITRYYVPGVLIVTALTLGLGLWLNGIASVEAWEEAFHRALVVLVAASPCALAISTPTSVLSAIGAAARQKILIKGGEFVELLSKVNTFVFDKTGTLTRGKPSVSRISPFPGFTELEVLETAGMAEQRSQHPFAQALISLIQERGISLDLPDSTQILDGIGIEAFYLRKGLPERAVAGSLRLLESLDIQPPPFVLAEAGKMEADGLSVALVLRKLVASGKVGTHPPWELLGLIGVTDPLRPESSAAVAALRRNGIDSIHMLTGDNQKVAGQIAAEAGIRDVHAGLLPEQKVSILQELAAQNRQVAMVGDGFNDAPSLATAPVGIAMGMAGVGVALETADVVLLTDDLNRLPFLIRLARRADRVLAQNLFISVATMVFLVAWVYVGWLTKAPVSLPLPLAVVGHEGSTLLVAFNGLRLLAMSAKS